MKTQYDKELEEREKAWKEEQVKAFELTQEEVEKIMSIHYYEPPEPINKPKKP